MIRLPLLLMGAGLLLILLSWFWPALTGSHGAWSDQQAQEHTRAAADLHRLKHDAAETARRESAVPGPQPREDSPALLAAKARWADSDAQLESTRGAHAGLSSLLRWLGILAASAGAAVFFVQRRAGRLA